MTDKEHHINDSFNTAKDLIYGLPIVPIYDLISQLAQDIARGDFEDLGPLSEARNNWDAWLDRTKQILRSRNIIIS